MEKGLITFFNIDACGLYKRKLKSDDEFVENGITPTIESVIHWAKNRDFIDSLPVDPESNSQASKIYFKSAEKDDQTGDFFLVFIKKTSDDSGHFHGIKPRSKFGDNAGDSVKVGKKIDGEDAIFGPPLYYWIIPEFDLIASIKFPHSVAETDSIASYIKKSFEYKIDHRFKRKLNERVYFNNKIMRNVQVRNIYFEDPANEQLLKFKIGFSEKRVTIKEVDHNSLAKRISHIITRDVVKAKNIIDTQHPVLSIFSQFLGKKKNIDKRQVEIETEVSLTGDELKELIEIYDAEHNVYDEWANIGFRINGEENPKFFNNYIERASIYIDPVEKFEENYFESATIKKSINEVRKELLNTLYVQNNSPNIGTGTDG